MKKLLLTLVAASLVSFGAFAQSTDTDTITATATPLAGINVDCSADTDGLAFGSYIDAVGLLSADDATLAARAGNPVGTHAECSVTGAPNAQFTVELTSVDGNDQITMSDGGTSSVLATLRLEDAAGTADLGLGGTFSGDINLDGTGALDFTIDGSIDPDQASAFGVEHSDSTVEVEVAYN